MYYITIFINVLQFVTEPKVNSVLSKNATNQTTCNFEK